MATLTLKQFAEMLSSLVVTDQDVGNLTIPIDFQDMSAETLKLENDYQKLLDENKFEDAVKFRKENPVLESRILDAYKLNYIQSLMITAFELAKSEKTATSTSFDNKNSGLSGSPTNVQGAIDETVKAHKTDITNMNNKIEDTKKMIPTFNFNPSNATLDITLSR